MTTENNTNKYLGAGREACEEGAQIPFLRVLQPAAAEINPANPDYEMKKIEGAKAGDIFHPSIGVLWKKPVRFVPTKSKHYYEERDGMESNSRIVAVHNSSITSHPGYHQEGVLETIERTVVREGKEFIATHRLVATTVWGIILPDYNNATALLKFQSSQLRHARILRDSINRFRYSDDPKAEKGLPPTFAQSFCLNTVAEKNAKGSWMALSITKDKVLDPKSDGAIMDKANSLLNEPLLPGASTQPQLTGETE